MIVRSRADALSAVFTVSPLARVSRLLFSTRKEGGDNEQGLVPAL